MSWISPKCLKGYRIDCRGAGRIELNEEGERRGCPEPIVGNCSQSDGLCWWLRPVGFAFTITLPIANLKRFWAKS